MRQAWIDETKPRPEVREDSDVGDFVDRRGEQELEDPDSMFIADDDWNGNDAQDPMVEDGGVAKDDDANAPDFDELDQLLAEGASAVPDEGNAQGGGPAAERDEFADEEEVMAEMGW